MPAASPKRPRGRPRLAPDAPRAPRSATWGARLPVDTIARLNAALRKLGLSGREWLIEVASEAVMASED